MNLKEFDEKLAAHDWHYAMSDDYRVWQCGEKAHSAIVATTKLSPEHKALYDLYYKHKFTGKPWSTPEFTRAELDAERAKLLGSI